jgi:hypothetical protein
MTREPIGFKNPFPRRGTKVDRWLRRRSLKKTRERLPSRRELLQLERRARVDINRTKAEMGIPWGGG